MDESTLHHPEEGAARVRCERVAVEHAGGLRGEGGVRIEDEQIRVRAWGQGAASCVAGRGIRSVMNSR